MSILAQIAALEEAVAQLLAGVSLARATDRQRHRAAAAAILGLLDKHNVTLDWLQTLEAEALIRAALDEVFSDWTDQLRSEIASTVSDIASITEEFYTSHGVDVTGIRDAAQRSELAAELAEGFEIGQRHIHQQLADATKDAMQRALLSGEIDRNQIAAEIEREAGATTRVARVQAQAAVAGLNQVHRNQVAERAELDFFHYHGSLQINSREFCRIHIGYVYPRRRVLQMKNGMLEPVMIFKGGFNCRHSWLPVNPDWSPDLAARIVDEEPTEVCLDAACRRKIVVVAPAGRISRLQAQIALRPLGFSIFFDAESNDTGFVAIQTAWWTERFRRRAGTRRRREMDDELEDARQRAETGEIVKLTIEDDE